MAGLTAAAASLVMLVLPVSAQSGASVHLAITGGPHPGTFDVQTAEACVAEDSGGWSLIYYDETQSPASLEVHVGTGALDSLTVMFEDGEGYISTELSADVEQADGTTILSVTAPASDLASYGMGGDIATVELRLECGGGGAATPEPTEVPPPTPGIQGPPAEGSTVFHLTLDVGPWAGTYDAWTLEQACSAGDVGWSASYVDPASIPSSVSLVSVDVEGEDAPVVVMSVTFGAFPDFTLYETSTEASIELDAERGTAQVHDANATAIMPDLTERWGVLDVSIECAPVVP